MSDDILRIIATDPRHAASEATLDAARRAVEAALPEGTVVEAQPKAGIEFIDPGESFGSVSCPRCGESLDEWWPLAMSEDFAGPDEGFRLAELELPCCGARLPLDALAYDPPCGFGRWVIDARNVRPESEAAVSRIAGATLGVPVRAFRAHD